jgi:EAL domain-containing protein (putative c-di-GMP-specific phosphodiesterase class I)
MLSAGEKIEIIDQCTIIKETIRNKDILNFMDTHLASQQIIHGYNEIVDELREILHEQHSLSILYIDCSRLSEIEKLHGKKVYTDVLHKIQSIVLGLRGKEFRKDDLIVSNATGQDELIIFLSQKRTDRKFSAGDLEHLCERLTDSLNDEFFTITYPYLRGRPKIVIGYAVTIYNPIIREERLINRLLDDAKKMAEYQKFRRLMRNKEKLQELILKESISTVFQPIVDFSSNSIIGYEALSRGPFGTEYENPYILFDAAAETELLFELDQLCRKKALTNSKGLIPGYKLFLNCIPNAVLDPHFRGLNLQHYLDELKLEPINMVLEVTEREAIESYDLFREAIKYFSDLGFAIAVDDTGAGYSNLETVLELKPQYIKIDISIVRGVDSNVLKQELIRAIKRLAREMGSVVIAEGIETQKELEALKKIGISVGQGYIFSKPGPAFPGISSLK